MTVKLQYKDLVKFLVNDEEQRKSLKILAEKRDMPMKALLRRGIFCVPDLDELGYLLEQWGLTFEEAFGKDREDARLFNEGFIIPVLDSSYRIQFFVNYNWERGGARKYLNVYPDGMKETSSNMKMFGAHNLDKAVKEDWIVVIEGMFDGIRLESEDIPQATIMGTKLLVYQKRFLSRFSRVVFVSDADYEGSKGWRNVNKGLDNVIHYPIKGLAKDVDAFAKGNTPFYREWIEGLKQFKPVKRG